MAGHDTFWMLSIAYSVWSWASEL